MKVFLDGLRLELSEEKTLITNIKKKTAKFLGVLIGTNYLANSRKRITVNGITRRIGGMNITMKAPMRSLIQRLVAKGFIEIKNHKYRSKPILSLSPLPTIQLILRYRSILKGYTQYYSFADNIERLKYIYLFLRNSLMKTICYKEKLNLEEFNRTYGKNIKVSIKKSDGKCVSLNFPLPKFVRDPKNFLYKEQKDPLLAKKWSISSIFPLDQNCANCGTDRNIEMHHIKHIRTINPKLSSFDKMVAKLNRKQVPLCRNCHRNVHSGNYCGFSLKYFKCNK